MIAEMYGGKVDNEGDFEQLKRIVNDVVDPAAYELDHRLVQPRENDDGLKVPSGTTLPDFRTWVAKLPEREPPTYLGLPPNAEKVLLAQMGQAVIGDLKRVSDMLEEDELATTEGVRTS
jgi:dynein heavy chain 1, cytosolic